MAECSSKVWMIYDFQKKFKAVCSSINLGIRNYLMEIDVRKWIRFFITYIFARYVCNISNRPRSLKLYLVKYI